MPYGLKDIELAKLNEVFAANERIERVILYGSRAKGNYKPFSDVDITLEGAELTHNDLSRFSLAIDDLLLPYQFDISIFHTLKNEALIDHIRRMGITIYEKKSEWKEYKLGEIADITPGFAFKSKDFGQTGELVVKIKDIAPPYIELANADHVDLSSYDKNKLSKYLLCEGDYVVAMTGATIGKVGKLKTDKYAYLNQRVAKIKAKEGVCDDFVYFSICGDDFQSFIQNNIDSNSAQENISANSIGRFPVSLPPLNEQRCIAAIFSSLDNKIDLLHRENATLERMAETLFRQWFVVEAKEEWEESQFAEAIEVFDYLRRPLSKMERDKMKNGEQLYPYYGAAEIMDYIDSYLFDGEYILMGEDGTVKTDDGYPILQYATGKFWPNNHAHVLQAKSPYNNCFIWNYLKTTNIESIVTGAVQPKINQANLLSLPFYKYPIKLVEMYMRITDDWWSKIMMNNKQIQALIQTRDGLLPRLMGREVKI